ncbi:MAG TPA: hypothetical protein VGO67_22700 [Verrucomicrobiae bacterium]|jgi:hypothetical protein
MFSNDGTEVRQEEANMLSFVAQCENKVHPDIIYKEYGLPGMGCREGLCGKYQQFLVGMTYCSKASTITLVAISFISEMGQLPLLALNGSTLSAATVAQQLLNNPTLANTHPYSFVFLDCCNSAKGSDGTWAKAFGIPPKTGLTGASFNNAMVPPRAFMGWSMVKQIGYENQIDNGHVNFLEGFWTAWSTPNSQHQYTTTLQDAIAFAKSRPDVTGLTAAGLVVYGASDLLIND